MKLHSPAIAVIGMACIYPDAQTPVELWENVLAQRRAFRKLPQERLRSADYWSADASVPDRTYSSEAAVIEGYEFDRVAFRVAGPTYRSADLAHWLALDVASRALADAGSPEGQGMPREMTGVILGNSLTGEFSRANLLRLRWPYTRRVMDAALARKGWALQSRRDFLDRLEADYKAPFPPVGEETLAGGLSNTIAGRICNQFDFKGGGFTVDGACASSLLAVASACSSLAAGDLDVAVAGGIDLSLDPFELVGFAKTGALAAEEMRVYDRRAQGFWPGEGCGFVVLMRQEDALAQGRRVYAWIRGWGVSSDGSGGITRPEAAGQLEAFHRAYRRAGFGPQTVAFCEGHGTGTSVGDATELQVLASARREAGEEAAVAVVGSVKANIGHTKAAAGIAGFIKATMTVHAQVLPPATACDQPHTQLTAPDRVLKVLHRAEAWPSDQPLRASVSAMGFGGINAHVVLEGAMAARRSELSAREMALSRSPQDAELFLFAAADTSELRDQVRKVRARAEGLSRAELSDLAASLERALDGGELRAAVVAPRAADLAKGLDTLESWLDQGTTARLSVEEGVFLGSGSAAPAIAFLFTGQGSPTHLDGGLWSRRFDAVHELYDSAAPPAGADLTSTRVMQPAIVRASLAGLRVAASLGLEAVAVAGHSLGELTALHWAGVFDEAALLEIARVRGAAMADLGSPTGAMLAVGAPADQVSDKLPAGKLTIVGYNSPRQTVVAGEKAAVGDFLRIATAAGWRVALLPVSHAFHTPLVAAAAPVLAKHLEGTTFASARRSVVSTITGGWLKGDEDLRALLCRQVTAPVRYSTALTALLAWRPLEQADGRQGLTTGKVDLLIEVGPGEVLTGLARDLTQVPVIGLDAGGPSLRGLLSAVGAAFALGAPIRHGVLFADRFTRPFSLERQPRFFASPCESAPASDDSRESPSIASPATGSESEPPANGQRVAADSGDGTRTTSALELVRKLVADRAELPVTAVRDENRMLSDLHLNSITVGQLVAEAARRLALPRIVGLTDFTNASVAEVASALEELKATGATRQEVDQKREPPGVDFWFDTFQARQVPVPRPASRTLEGVGGWEVVAPENHPLAAVLRPRLSALGGGGVCVCLPERPDAGHFALLLQAARAIAGNAGRNRLVVVQHGWGGAGFAKTLHLENTGLTTCVINIPGTQRVVTDWIVAEIFCAAGYSEVSFTATGERSEIRIERLPSACPTPAQAGYPIAKDDVLLVTGGGKGIAAESALALGRATGASLILMGRSDPAADQELRANLERFEAAGVRCAYARADVTDPSAVSGELQAAQARLGPVTAILHGAGTNTPQLISALDEAAFRRTLAPKIDGIRNVLGAVDPGRLRLLVTFGSIIARAGLRGEADYATANEWMTAFTEEFQAAHPGCRCLAVEWSVWSGIGMGERLGRMESLIQQGITPIPPDEGVRLLLELLQRPECPTAVVVAGRFGNPATLRFAEADLPLRRFLERPRVYYPGVELVVDTQLSEATDPYLQDHVVQKQVLFPAVMGLEAMAQAAMAVAGSSTPPAFERVQLARPVALSDKTSTTIRIAVLRRGPDLFEACLRSEETDFHVDHFRALCRFGVAVETSAGRLPPEDVSPGLVVLDPERDLYGKILFHSGRFRRLKAYEYLRAKECRAQITASLETGWFGPYMPAGLALGDPGARDSALHAIQACIPHQRILPTGIERLVVLKQDPGLHRVRATEREHQGNNFTYDLEVRNLSGELLEQWEGLRLRAVENLPLPQALSPGLLAPYLERRLGDLAPQAGIEVVVSTALHSDRSGASDEALRQGLDQGRRIWRRPDGKPVTLDGPNVCASHCQPLTLGVIAPGVSACDIEVAAGKTPQAWQDLLGADRWRLSQRISSDNAEPVEASAARVWTAVECMKKAGLPLETALVLDSSADGWTSLRSGAFTIATWVTPIGDLPDPIAIGIGFGAGPGAEKQPHAAEAIA